MFLFLWTAARARGRAIARVPSIGPHVTSTGESVTRGFDYRFLELGLPEVMDRRRTGLAALALAFSLTWTCEGASGGSPRLPPTPFEWEAMGDRVSHLHGTYVHFTVVNGEPVAIYRDAFKGTRTLDPVPEVKYETALRTHTNGKWVEHPFPSTQSAFSRFVWVDGRPILCVDELRRTGRGNAVSIRFYAWKGAGQIAALPYAGPARRVPYPGNVDHDLLAKYPALFRVGDGYVVFYADERPIFEFLTGRFEFRRHEALTPSGVLNPVVVQAHGAIHVAYQELRDGAAVTVLRRYDGRGWKDLQLPPRPTTSLDPIYWIEVGSRVYFTEGRKDGHELVLHEVAPDGSLTATIAPGLPQAPRYSFAALKGRLFAATVDRRYERAPVLSEWTGTRWSNYEIPGVSSPHVRAAYLAADEAAGKLYVLYQYERIERGEGGAMVFDRRMRAAVGTP